MTLHNLIGFVVSIVLAMSGTASAQVTVADRLAEDEPPIIISHRAQGGGYPENTLAGIQHAIDRGIDAVEIDVQITSDGQYVIFHDWIGDRTMEEIGALYLTDERGGEHQIPTLEQALEVSASRVLVILDLKVYDPATLIPLLASWDLENILLFDHHNPEEQFAAVVEATSWPVFATVEGFQDPRAALDKMYETFGSSLVMVDGTRSQLTPEFLADAEARSVRICTWGVPWEDRRLLAGSSGPWEAALETDVSCHMTGQPNAVLDLMGR